MVINEELLPKYILLILDTSLNLTFLHYKVQVLKLSKISKTKTKKVHKFTFSS